MKIASKFILAILTAGTFALAPAHANLIQNGGFESGPDGSESAPGFVTVLNGQTSIDDWTVIGDSVDYIGSYWVSAEGQHSLDLSGNNAGGVEQTFATTIGQTYHVTFDLAGNPDGGPTVKNLITTTVGGINSFNFDTTGSSDGSMNWTQESFDFTAIADTTLLSFVSTDDTLFGPALDAVDVEVGGIIPSPEPSTFALVGLGILGLVFVARKNKFATT